MDKHQELDKLFNKTQDKLAEGISAILRNIKERENRIIALKKMKKQLSLDILKRIYEIAIKKEDYETCDAIKMYCKEKGLKM